MIVLDTNALLWSVYDERRLGKVAHRHIGSATETGGLAVSAFSFWGIAMLTAKGRIGFPKDVGQFRADLFARDVRELPVSGEIGIAAAQLRGFHPDPADRIIAATALRHRAKLVTADRHILAWDGPLERLDARL